LEGLEDPVVVRRWDPDPGVGDAHVQLAVGHRGGHRDDAAVGRELHRVREQVEHHLLEAERVRLHLADLRSHLEAQLDPVPPGPLAHE